MCRPGRTSRGPFSPFLLSLRPRRKRAEGWAGGHHMGAPWRRHGEVVEEDGMGPPPRALEPHSTMGRCPPPRSSCLRTTPILRNCRQTRRRTELSGAFQESMLCCQGTRMNSGPRRSPRWWPRAGENAHRPPPQPGKAGRTPQGKPAAAAGPPHTRRSQLAGPRAHSGSAVGGTACRPDAPFPDGLIWSLLGPSTRLGVTYYLRHCRSPDGPGDGSSAVRVPSGLRRAGRGNGRLQTPLVRSPLTRILHAPRAAGGNFPLRHRADALLGRHSWPSGGGPSHGSMSPAAHAPGDGESPAAGCWGSPRCSGHRPRRLPGVFTAFPEEGKCWPWARRVRRESFSGPGRAWRSEPLRPGGPQVAFRLAGRHLPAVCSIRPTICCFCFFNFKPYLGPAGT